MNITERLLKLDPSLQLHNEGEWNNTASAYSAFNSGGVECETGEFLYGLLRLIKPENVLETGTHFGVGASYMGLALKDNHGGLLDTYEFLPEIFQVALQRFKVLELTEHVRAHLQDVATVNPSYPYQVVLLDTEPNLRFNELLKFYPHVSEGGFIFIHDLHRHMHQIPNEEHGFAWPYGPIPAEMKDLVISGKLRPFHFSTPRGLTGFYKLSDSDYKWI